MLARADSDAIKVSCPNDNIRYISNIDNMRDNIRSAGSTNRSFVLWMYHKLTRRIELGYTLALFCVIVSPAQVQE